MGTTVTNKPLMLLQFIEEGTPEEFKQCVLENVLYCGEFYFRTHFHGDWYSQMTYTNGSQVVVTPTLVHEDMPLTPSFICTAMAWVQSPPTSLLFTITP